MSYKVGRYSNIDGTAREPKHYMSRAQAIHGMRKLAYETLKGFGKLDTQAAHDVMAQIDTCDDIIPPQAQRTVHISNTGYFLTLVNTARQPR